MDNNELKKYRELYNLTLKIYDDENKRYEYLELKAFRFLSALTIILGIYSYIFSSLEIYNFKYSQDYFDIILKILGIILLSSLIICWIVFLTVMITKNLKALPVKKSIEFYKENKLIDIYNTMSKGIDDAVLENREVTEKKVKKLEYGYKILIINGILIILLLILSFIYNIIK